MDTKLLKKKILDLAIRGKLVPQDPNDEPASVLLERIRTEREKLIFEGKLKRSKTTTDNRHYENVPFEIPESWEWVRLSDIANVGTGATPKTNITEYYNGDIPWITSSSTRKEIIDKPVSLISKKAIDETNCKIYKAGTIIIAMYGEGKTRGQVSELAIDSATNQACAAISLFDIELKDYVKAYLKYSYGGIRYLSVGGVQPNLNLKVIGQFQIPLPPYSEQLRIVTEIKRWFTLIEDLEENKQALQEAIKLAKIEILSLAISGKLVTQDPNEVPAIELLKRINPKFVPCDNSHYENLPQGWQIAPMQMLCKLTDGARQKGIKRINLDVKYLRGKGVGNVLSAGRFVPANSTMILVDGENSGEVFTTPIDGYQGSTFKLLNISDEIYKPFIMYVIKSHQKHFRENKVGSAIPHLNKKLFKEIDVFVPPFEEQKRIVRRIVDIFASLDEITAEL